MNEKVLRKLEFDKIIGKLKNYCVSSLGEEIAAELKPVYNLATIQQWLEQTSEAKEVLRLTPYVPLMGIKDVGTYLHKAKIGGLLNPQMLLEIKDTLTVSQKMARFCEKLHIQYKHLKKLGEDIVILQNVEAEINRCILPEGHVADNATAELKQIRSSMRSKQGQIKDKLDNIIRSATYQKYLQEPIVTIRNDRYVVPVKVEYRAQVPGILHDQSASGATLFIEPMTVVELNNEVRGLETREEQEIQKILAILTNLVLEYVEEMQQNLDVLAELDFIFAKGKLSQSMDGGAPTILENSSINIIQGRHPLIAGKVVPISIHLGDSFDTLVITGPNTGGKTVTLKTVGLFVLMAQAGLHLPCETGSTISIFEQVFVDIGDEQSIEQSLSTFSSHMTNIISIVNQVTAKSLVLMDELGAGTDPTEGAALGMAILEYLHNKDAKTIATTHYSELKAFAYANDRVENGSVEFDSITLRPTYKLLIGIPGKSNAFEISQRLGLQDQIVAKAKEFLSKEEIKVADLIKNLEQNEMLTERALIEAEEIKREALNQLKQVQNKEDIIREREQEIYRKAREEADEVLLAAKRTANELIKEIKEARTKALTEQEKLAIEARDKLSKERDINIAQINQYEEANVSNHIAPKNIKPGDMVHLPKYNQKAQVLTLPNVNGEVQVQAGILKINVNISEIHLLQQEKTTKGKEFYSKIAKTKAQNINQEIDIRGLLVDEAMYQLEKYLDDAYISGLPFVRIIHGKGTGALRKAIQEFLKTSNYVKSYRLADYDEGGSGATVVEF